MVEALKQQPRVVGFVCIPGHLGAHDRTLDDENGGGSRQLGLTMIKLRRHSLEKLLQFFLVLSRDGEGLAVKLSTFGHRIDKGHIRENSGLQTSFVAHLQ